MIMTLDQILDLMGTLALFVPTPVVQIGVPALVKIARDVAHSGAFDATTVVELDDVGKEYAKAVDALIVELAKQKTLATQKG